MKQVVLSGAAALCLMACGSEPAPTQDHAMHDAAGHVDDKAGDSVEAQSVDGVAISNAIIRPPLGGKDVTAGYFTISSDVDDKIVGAETNIADVVELHTHEHVDGVMKMRKVEAIELIAGEPVKFAPKGKHLMIFGVQGIAEGDTVEMTLKLESGKELSVDFLVAVPEVSAHAEH